MADPEPRLLVRSRSLYPYPASVSQRNSLEAVHRMRCDGHGRLQQAHEGARRSKHDPKS